MKARGHTLLKKHHIAIEFALLLVFTMMFDIALLVRFGIRMAGAYWIISIASASILAAFLVIINKNKTRFIAYVAYIIMQVGLFIADSCLYFFKRDLISLAMLLEIKNALVIGLKYNIFITFSPLVWLFFLWVTAGFVYALYFLTMKTGTHQKFRWKNAPYIVVTIAVLIIGGVFIQENDRILYNTPEDKKAFVQTFGLSTFHQRDAVSILRRIFIVPFEKQELLRVASALHEDPTLVVTPNTGLFEGKNVIMIICETCEEYAFDPVLTPNYERMKNHGFHFVNAFSAAKLNYTYDAEFKSLVSQMYFKTDNFMYTLENNTFSSSLPAVLRQHGYSANAFHSYERQFFNRNEIYKGMGFERYYASDDMTFSEYDYWALDSEMFDQMKHLMAPIQDQPFFTYVITLTNHGPHNIERRELSPYYELIEEEGSHRDKETSFKTLMAAHMDLDKGLGILLSHLEDTGLADDTIILFYTDHKNYSSFDITLKYKPVGENPFDIERMPYLIYSPGMERVNVEKITSHYDMTPTLFDLLGIKYYQEYYYGESVFKEERPKPIIFNYTSWMDDRMIVLENKIVWFDSPQIQNAKEYQLSISQQIYQVITISEIMLLSDYLKDVRSFQ